MNDNIFRYVSLRGRISYVIMCAENYALATWPGRDWAPLFEKLWSIDLPDTLFDEWAQQVVELIPEFLFEFENYESSDFECLSEEGYDRFCALECDTDEAWNKLLNIIFDMEEAYAFTSIDGVGFESLKFLDEAESILV